MIAQKSSLQSQTSQAIESTFEISSFLEARMNFQQTGRVTIRGGASEKRTRARVYEAVVISFFLLSLFLTGCSGSLTGVPREPDADARLQLTGEATVPPSTDVSNATSNPVPEKAPSDVTSDAPSDTPPNADVSVAMTGRSSPGLLKSFISEEAVVERVKLVTGWLKFVHQLKAAERIENGWRRLQAGHVIGALDTRPVVAHPELSTSELMLWRQLLKPTPSNEGADGTVLSQEAAKRLELLAALLTASTSPDDLTRVDKLLFDSVMVARE